KAKHIITLQDRPGVVGFLRWRALGKQLSTHGSTLASHAHPITGRLHANYNIAAAKTGRASCSNPTLHNLPTRRFPAFRGCFRAHDGHVLVSGDWVQMELRVAGWISDDPVFCGIYERGEDLHRNSAIVLCKLPPGVEPTPEQRQKAKAGNFLWIY